MERRNFLKGLAMLGACPVCARAARAAEDAHWGYDGEAGPTHWGGLSADNIACSAGSQQSPLNITGTIPADLPAIEIAWKRGGTMVNNGHTIQINVPAGSTLSRGGKVYEMVQYHFHSPSEHLVEGRGFAMEAHFVHKHTASGNLGVLGIMLIPGGTNPTFANLAAAFPKEGDEATAGAVDPAGLLPASLAYWTYEGSLTTPPCSEIVDWMVAKNPIEVAPGDIAKFTAFYPMNARPALPDNRRFILATN